MKTIIKSIIAVTIAFTLFGCGEEREHKPLAKFDVFPKSAVGGPNSDIEYLFVASTGEVSRTTSQGRPYFQDQEQIVKLKFEEKHLVAYSVDKETQFQGNANNGKIVFKIPIEHVEYREQTDAFGEGTNVEEENEFVHWTKASHFKASAEEFQFTSASTLPAEFSKIFGESKCNKEQGQVELEFKVAKTGVDIVIRRDYTSNYFCERDVDFSDLNSLAWSQETHYSLVPLNDVISKDYKAKHYSREWERTFGFFDRTEKFLDSSNNITQSQERYIMHRWNPDRKLITYHLDPRLNKPENSVLKGATLKAFERLNAALKEAGAKMRLEAVDGPADFKPGDIKMNSIVLVEDPVAAGLLGYGPSVTNPRTGEIVQARTVMYPGIMKKLIRRAYDELIEINKQQNADVASVNLNKMKQSLAATLTPANLGSWKPFVGEVPLGESSSVGPEGSAPKQVALQKQLVKESFFKRSLSSLRTLFSQGEDSEKNEGRESLELNGIDLFDAYSRNNMFPAQPVTFTDITDKVLKEKILRMGQEKPWDELKEETRIAIVDLVMPFVWIPTLIHEVGHNLGLRHNFAGSEDKENFYTIEELAKRGVESELGSPYSSMMEYSKSEVTGLRVPGKYDVAALRYGYANNVELVDGSIVAATEVKPEGMKNFEFCTDEGVALNPNCNRFDEGTNLVEIVESMIDSYYKRYKMSYFRNERSHFSMYDDYGNTIRTNNMFKALRLAFERLTDIMIDYDLPMEEVKGIEWLNDYNEASKIAAKFLMDIVAEPDYSCVVYRNGDFNSVMSFVGLQKLVDATAKSCSAMVGKLTNGFTIEGELGRSMESRRFRDNPNIFLDQIDVRGVWFHKFLAIRTLTRRTLNSFSFDENTVSYFDHPEIGPELSIFLKEMMMGRVRTNVEVRLNDGSSFIADYQHNFAEGYEIKEPLDSRVSRYMGVPVKKINLAPELLKVIKTGIAEGLQTSTSISFYQNFNIYRSTPESFNRKGYETYDFFTSSYIFNRKQNDLAANIIDRLKLVNSVYTGFTREELIAIFEKMQAPPETGAPEYTEKEQTVVKGGPQTLYDHLTGVLPSNEYYYNLLNAM